MESVNSSSQQNTVYGLIIPQETGKQLALMAALFSIKLIVEKFRRAVWEKKAFQVQVIVCRLMSHLRRFQAGLAFSLKHLIKQADVQFCWEDEFTDYTFRANVLKSVSPSHVQNMIEKIILASYSDNFNFVTRYM